MAYTTNQHMLSQWVLRNFRSDDTALHPKNKQRVWAHVVVPTAEGENDIKDIPLPISSVAVCKDCFRLTDGVTGELFDIEHELSAYEHSISVLVRELVQEHQFARLADCDTDNFPVEDLAGFAILQMMLNLNNPQSRFPDKASLLESLIKPVVDNICEHVSAILSLTTTHPTLAEQSIYQKLIRIAGSSSGAEDKARALFILYSILALQKKQTPLGTAAYLRDEIFSGIYVIDVFHTGHDFNSTEPRPVFTVSANVFCALRDERIIYLPLSHNIALRFNQVPGKGFYQNPAIRVFSPVPSSLKCSGTERLEIYQCSYDFIDQVMSTIDMYNNGCSNIIYSSWQLSDVENYLKLQDEQPDTWYLPEHPVRWTAASEKG
ncbi:DUF4238 domain-containing protein [Phytobacter diazotrophicus]|uniref:DUF4238 domain-containing protein n=1 Tax=Phytobacter diazotrophicus TaxID=395631 RepID=UPI00307601AE